VLCTEEQWLRWGAMTSVDPAEGNSSVLSSAAAADASCCVPGIAGFCAGDLLAVLAQADVLNVTTICSGQTGCQAQKVY
jgi:hypothetical protein